MKILILFMILGVYVLVANHSKTIQCMQIFYISNGFSAVRGNPLLIWSCVPTTTGGLSFNQETEQFAKP